MIRPDGGKSAAKAAHSSVYLAASPDVAGVNGDCFNPESEVADRPKAVLDQAVRRHLHKAENRSAKSSHTCARREDARHDPAAIPEARPRQRTTKGRGTRRRPALSARM